MAYQCTQAEAQQLEAEQRAWQEGRPNREELTRKEKELAAEAERLQVQAHRLCLFG